MGCAVLERPVAHGGGYRVSNGGIEGGSFVNGLHEALEDGLGQALLHDVFAEDVGIEDLLQVNGLEIHILKLVLGRGDGIDCFLASVGHIRLLFWLVGCWHSRGLRLKRQARWIARAHFTPSPNNRVQAAAGDP